MDRLIRQYLSQRIMLMQEVVQLQLMFLTYQGHIPLILEEEGQVTCYKDVMRLIVVSVFIFQLLFLVLMLDLLSNLYAVK